MSASLVVAIVTAVVSDDSLMPVPDVGTTEVDVEASECDAETASEDDPVVEKPASTATPHADAQTRAPAQPAPRAKQRINMGNTLTHRAVAARRRSRSRDRAAENAGKIAAWTTTTILSHARRATSARRRSRCFARGRKKRSSGGATRLVIDDAEETVISDVVVDPDGAVFVVGAFSNGGGDFDPFAARLVP